MKKIFFLIGQLSGGGAEWQCLLQANMLAESGFDVTLFTLSSKNDYLKRLSNKAPNLEIKQLCNISFGNKLCKLCKLLKSIFSFRKMIKSNPGVIVYSWLEVCHTISFFSCFKTKSKLIWAIRNSNVSEGKKYWKMNFLINLNAKLSGSVKSLISNSKVGLQHYIETLRYKPKNNHVIYNVIDEKFLNYNPSQEEKNNLKKKLNIEDKKIILTVARLTPQKSYDLLIKSISDVVKKIPEAVFIFVGTGEEEYVKYLKGIAGKKNVSKHILWLGHIDDPRLLMSSCNIFILASSYGEGLSNSLLEAAALRCICASTDIGDNRLITTPGLLIKNNESISEKIIFALNETKYNYSPTSKNKITEGFTVEIIQEKINRTFSIY